ncbi:hypothetical protein [Campylobacter ureolyticus]|uniref:hypothetical protein n=1 Tax=Campylobacter ureolyticus TaxID=827 RepID=UPI00046AB211|nr:hypothetical protein [Campylobacter ureolyticus]QIX86599.1 hypothetical protein FOB81_04605 [Campylobacter ureolyticus]STA71114.1 DNA primase (bacterial type) [Campylobacter ureolyticus]
MTKPSIAKIKQQLNKDIVIAILNSQGFNIPFKGNFRLRADDKNPSTSIAKNGLIKDFNGSFAGDVFDCLQTYRGMDFKQAVEYVKGFLGIGAMQSNPLPTSSLNKPIKEPIKKEFKPNLKVDEVISRNNDFLKVVFDNGLASNLLIMPNAKYKDETKIIKDFLNNHLGSSFITYLDTQGSLLHFKEAFIKYIAFFNNEVQLKFSDENNHFRLLKRRVDKWIFATEIRFKNGNKIKNIPMDTKFISHHCFKTDDYIFISFHAIDSFIFHSLGLNYITLQSSSFYVNDETFKEVVESFGVNAKAIFLIDLDKTQGKDLNTDYKASVRLKDFFNFSFYRLMAKNANYKKQDLRDMLLTLDNFLYENSRLFFKGIKKILINGKMEF